MAGPRNRPGGFTLIEVLLTVVLLCVAAAVAIPNFSSPYRKALLQQSAGQAAALMRYAQSRAIITRQPVRFIYDGGSESYRLAPEFEGALRSGEADGQRLSGRWGRTFSVPRRIVCRAQIPEVTFYPDGRADKSRFDFCAGEDCLRVSTGGQRGRVLMLQKPNDK